MTTLYFPRTEWDKMVLRRKILREEEIYWRAMAKKDRGVGDIEINRHPEWIGQAKKLQKFSIEDFSFSLEVVSVSSRPDEDEWAKDSIHFLCTLHATEEKTKPSRVFYYSMGSAHTYRWPRIFNVLQCVVMDATTGLLNFEEFCGDLGYDTDFKKAEKIWRACQETTVWFSRVGLDGDRLRDLEEFLREYEEKTLSTQPV